VGLFLAGSTIGTFLTLALLVLLDPVMTLPILTSEMHIALFVGEMISEIF
jgi:hypothetical protein